MSEVREDLLYTKDHEWISKPDSDGNCLIGITDFAQNELGDIVYVEVDTEGDSLSKDDVFGTIEAVKTVSDLFIPVDCEVLEINEALEDNPELVNTDPYGDGWIVKVKFIGDDFEEGLLNGDDYSKTI
jgi:glycine cleavage system H protein